MCPFKVFQLLAADDGGRWRGSPRGLPLRFQDLARQVFQFHSSVVCKNCGPLNNVDELSHVARPVVGFKCLSSFVAD